jgi:hypothetical protein
MKLTGTGQDFSISASSLTISRGTSGNTHVTVSSLGGFTGTVSVSVTNLPSGITASPVNISAGNTSPLTLNVTSSTGPGPFNLSLKGTSGSLTHTATLTLNVPLGGGVNTLVPRTSGTNAFPSTAVSYVTQLIADIAPVRLAECGTASAGHRIDVVYNPNQGFTNYDDNTQIITMNFLPTLDANGVDQNFDLALMHESTHALQTELLHTSNGVNLRGTIADMEGIAQACAYRIARNLAVSLKRPELRSGGDLSVLWLDTFRRIDPEIIAAGGWSASSAHVQPMRTFGEGSFLLAATQKGTDGLNGIIEHENTLFAAESGATIPPLLTADDRIRIWDSLSFHLDGQTPGAWMSQEMIQDPDFTPEIGKPQLIAWPVYPQFPAQMMAQAFVVVSDDPSTQPIVQPITSGPLTITVKDATPQQKAILTIQADLSQTTEIANYTPSLQTRLPQGTYTVFVDATINGTALESKFTVAVIPFDKTGLGTDDLNFPGQYLIAVDSVGNANGGALKVTRGTLVWSTPGIPGFAIVKPDSTGTFDVVGPSGTSHTYTAPAPWARFIPVE